MTKCKLTISGNHMFLDKILSKRKDRHIDESLSRDLRQTIYSFTPFYFKKCSACGLVDDTKYFSQAELDNEKVEEVTNHGSKT